MFLATRIRWAVPALVLSFGLLGFLPAPGQEKGVPLKVIQTLKGHTELVYTVAVSPDGNFLATGSFDKTIKLWEKATGKEIKTFAGLGGHTKQVLTVDFSPDGQTLISGGADNTLKFWDVPINSPLRKLASNEVVQSLALSLDGAKLAIAGKDGIVTMYATADAKELFKLAGHAGPVTGVAFSNNGQTLVTCGSDKTLRFWDAVKGQSLSVVGAHTSAVNALAIHPKDNTVYTVGEDGLLKFWQMPSIPGRTLPAQNASITALALSPDGGQVLTAGADKTIKQLQTAGKEIRALSGPKAPVSSLTFNNAASAIAAGTADSKLFLWNAADGKPMAEILAHGGAVTTLSFNAPNTQLLSGGDDGLLKIWAMPPVANRVIPHPDAVLTAVASADGKKYFTGGADKILRSWDPAKLALERQFTGHTGPVTALAVNSNGQLLFSGSADHTIRLWDQKTGKESEILGAHLGPVTSLALDAGAAKLVSSSEDGTVKLWQLPLAGPKPFAHPDQVTCVALSPDGSKLITGCQDKQVRMWNLAKAAKERDFPGATLSILAVAFSNDGKIAASSGDKTLHIWSSTDGKALQKATLPAAAQSVAFSPDSKILAAGLADGTIKLLNVADGKESKSIAAHKGTVTGLIYTPKGDALISAGSDKTIQTWNPVDGSPKAKLNHLGPVSEISLSKDGTRLAALAEKTVKVWNLADAKELASVTSPVEPRGFALAPEGTRLLLGGADKLARLYELDGKLVEYFPHDGPVLAAVFVDAKKIVTASADKQARLWTSSLIWQKSHQGPVRQALFTPKGDQIISAGDDKTIKFFNVADGNELRSLSAHDGPVTALSLSSDGTRLASTGPDKKAKVWNLAKPEDKPLAAMSLTAAPQSLAMSGNGSRLALGLTEKTSWVRVYDVGLGKEIQAFADHAAAIPSLTFLSDRTLFSASQDMTARLLEVGVLTALDAHNDGVVGAQFHSNNTQVLSAGKDKTIKLWDLAKGTTIKTFGPLPDPIQAVTFSRDYAQIGVAAGKIVKVWNLADGKELYTLNHPAEVLSLSFNVDKTRIATGAADKLTRVWDAATGKEMQFFQLDEAVTGVVFDPKTLTLVSTGGKIPRVDTVTNTRLIQADAGPVHALTVNAQGTHVLTGGSDKIGKLWNLGTGNVERTLDGSTGTVRTLAVNKANTLVASGGDDQVVRFYNFADGKLVGAHKMGGAVRGLAFSPNNLALAAAGADKTLIALNTNQDPKQPPEDFLKPIQSFTTPEIQQEVWFAPDNAQIYTSGTDKTVLVWRLASPTPTRSIAHPQPVYSVVFQSSGKLVASGCADGKLRLYEVGGKGALIKEINAHTIANQTMINVVAFTPDGKQVLSGSYDGSLKLWDIPGGNLVREFKAYKEKEFEQGHQEPVYAAAFSPDGKFLVSGSGGVGERVLKVWNVGDGKVLRNLANPSLKSTIPNFPDPSHPGHIYNIAFTRDGKHLISAGNVVGQKDTGFLAVWNPHDGKMLYGQATPMGVFFGLALTPDGTLALGAGPSGTVLDGNTLNNAYLLPIPILSK